MIETEGCIMKCQMVSFRDTSNSSHILAHEIRGPIFPPVTSSQCLQQVQSQSSSFKSLCTSPEVLCQHLSIKWRGIDIMLPKRLMFLHGTSAHTTQLPRDDLVLNSQNHHFAAQQNKWKSRTQRYYTAYFRYRSQNAHGWYQRWSFHCAQLAFWHNGRKPISSNLEKSFPFKKSPSRRKLYQLLAYSYMRKQLTGGSSPRRDFLSACLLS